jgi:hypothetical protein
MVLDICEELGFIDLAGRRPGVGFGDENAALRA